MHFSFDEGAEEKCHASIEKSLSADPNNPDALQLMASFLLTKEKNQVSDVLSILVWTSHQLFRIEILRTGERH